jgi:hypothetical protein
MIATAMAAPLCVASDLLYRLWYSQIELLEWGCVQS